MALGGLVETLTPIPTLSQMRVARAGLRDPRGTAAWYLPQPPAVPAFPCLSHPMTPMGSVQHHTLPSALLPVCSGLLSSYEPSRHLVSLGCCFLREALTNWPAPRDGPACLQLPVDARERGPFPVSHSP